MSNRTLGIVLLVVGVLIVAAVVLAGPLGLASSTFGTKKIVGVVVGAIVFVVGLVMSMRKPAKM